MIAPFRLSQIKKAKKDILSAEKKTFMFSFWLQATQSYFADLLSRRKGKSYNEAHNNLKGIISIVGPSLDFTNS